MKKLLSLALLLSITASVFAQEQEKEIVKTGLNFGPLPAIGYSSDYGWHYGALLNIFNYGDGSVYPDYRWLLKTEASWYSKGNSVYHLYFDSKYLIPDIRVAAAVSYFGNKTSAFYGYNGAPSLYVKSLDKITSAGQGFYLMRRDIFRVVTGFQGQIGDSHWSWATGLNFYSIKTGHAENKGLKGYDKKAKKPAEDYSLYDMYIDYGIIPEAEAKGGRHLEGLVGLVFDTRDHENNPTRGTNLEVMIYGSPDIINGRSGADWRNHYLKAAVHFKQFFPLVKDRLVFGGHLAYQGTIAGRTPFYMMQTIQFINMKQNLNEGLGSTTTLRGTVFNRLQGEGYAWGNFELRWSFARFKLFKQNFILALNPFFDLGAVVQPYRLEEMKRLSNQNADYYIYPAPVAIDDDGQGYWPHQFYTGQKEKLHMSAGSGLHIIMNQNFNINFEVGKCFDKNDGAGLGINVGLNYIF